LRPAQPTQAPLEPGPRIGSAFLSADFGKFSAQFPEFEELIGGEHIADSELAREP
jgi:hypothetical protein